MTEATLIAPAVVADTAVTPDPAVTATDWTTGLSDELKTAIASKGFKGPGDVTQAWFHAQKAIGADKIPMPKDGVWDPVAREKLGIPADPTGYKLTKPTMPEGLKWDETFEQAALPVAHKLGLTPAQVSGLMEFYAGHQGATFKTASEAQSAAALAAETTQAEALGALKTEWGLKFDPNLALASKAVQQIGGEKLVAALNESGFGNNIELVKAFAKIGAMLGEDTLTSGGAAKGVLTPAEAIAEANKLMQTEDYKTNNNPAMHKAAVEKVAQLMKMAHPDQTDISRGFDVRAA